MCRITHVLRFSKLVIPGLLPSTDSDTGLELRLSGNYGKMCKLKPYRPVEDGRLKR